MTALLVLLLAILSPIAAFAYPAKVVSVADGDTVTVLTEDQVQVKVRLAGIDAPERAQAFSAKSKQALSGKVFGKTIEVKEQSKKDRWGRSVADLYLGEKWINLDMVADGWAWHFKKYSEDERLAKAEQVARENKAGLWADANPVPPWDFRSENRKKAQE